MTKTNIRDDLKKWRHEALGERANDTKAVTLRVDQWAQLITNLDYALEFCAESGLSVMHARMQESLKAIHKGMG